MNLAALDLSLTGTGYADASGTGSMPTKLKGMERLCFLRDRVLHFCDGRDLVVIEGPSLHSKGRGTCERWGYRGIVLLALHDAGIPFIEIAPSSLKLFATGKGNAKKDTVMLAAARQGFEGADNDEADAWWLLQMARAHYTGSADTEYRKKALAKVDWPERSVA